MKQAPFFGERCFPRDRTGIRSGVLGVVWDLGIM
jgi:hypothetical protein